VAVSDRFGGLYNKDGLDIDACIAWVRQHGTLE
jgi:hypothetical protein